MNEEYRKCNITSESNIIKLHITCKKSNLVILLFT